MGADYGRKVNFDMDLDTIICGDNATVMATWEWEAHHPGRGSRAGIIHAGATRDGFCVLADAFRLVLGD